MHPLKTNQPIKVYLDGFHVDTIPMLDVVNDNYLTPKVKALLKEKGKHVTAVTAIPEGDDAKIVLVTTEI